MFDLVEHLLFVDVDEEVVVDSFGKAGTVDLPGLEDGVAIAEDDRGPPFVNVLDGIDGARVKAIGKWIFDEVLGNFKNAFVAGVRDAKALERAEVIHIAEFGPELFEDFPVMLLALSPHFGGDVVAQVLLDAVVVEQCVIDVK
jgi:hypothetical protein